MRINLHTMLSSLALLGGCSLYSPLTMAPSDRPVDTQFGTPRSGPVVRGESCEWWVLGFIPWGTTDARFEDALNEASRAAGRRPLGDITVDTEIFFAVLAHQRCVHVSGSVLVFPDTVGGGDRAAPAKAVGAGPKTDDVGQAPAPRSVEPAVAAALGAAVGEMVTLHGRDGKAMSGTLRGFDGEFVYLEMPNGATRRVSAFKVARVETAGASEPAPAPASTP
jgi:hypothetical protein